MRQKFASARGRGFPSFSGFGFNFDPFEDMHDERTCDCRECREVRKNAERRAEARRKLKDELRRKKEARDAEEKREAAALLAEEKLRKAKAKEEKAKKELEKREQKVKEAEEKKRQDELQAQREEELRKQTEASRNDASARSSVLMDKMRSALDSMKPEDKDTDVLNELIKEAKELLSMKRPDDGTNLMTVSLGREKLTKLQKKIVNLLTTDKNPPEVVQPSVEPTSTSSASSTELLKGSSESSNCDSEDKKVNFTTDSSDVNNANSTSIKKTVKFCEKVEVTEISGNDLINSNNGKNVGNGSDNGSKEKKSKEKKDNKKDKEVITTAKNATTSIKDEIVGQLMTMGFTEAQACRGFTAVNYQAGMNIDTIVSWIVENHGSEESSPPEKQHEENTKTQQTPERPAAPGFGNNAGSRYPYSFFGGVASAKAAEVANEKGKEKTSPSPSSVALGDTDNSLDFINQLQREGDAAFSLDTLDSAVKGLSSTKFDNSGIFNSNNSSLFNTGEDYPGHFDHVNSAMNLDGTGNNQRQGLIVNMNNNDNDVSVDLGDKSFYSRSFYSSLDTALDLGDLDIKNLATNSQVGAGTLSVFPLYSGELNGIENTHDSSSENKEIDGIGSENKASPPRMCKFDLKCRDGKKCKYRHSNDPVDEDTMANASGNSEVNREGDAELENKNEEDDKYVIINDHGMTIKLRSATARPCKFGEKCRDKRCTRRHTSDKAAIAAATTAATSNATTTTTEQSNKKVNNASPQEEPLRLDELAELKRQIDILKPTLSKIQRTHLDDEIAKMDISTPSTVRALQMFVNIMGKGTEKSTTASASNITLCQEITEEKGTEIKMCRYKNKCRDGAACKFRHPAKQPSSSSEGADESKDKKGSKDKSKKAKK